MNLEKVLNEKLEIKSEIEKLNDSFREYLPLVFNKEFLSKLDRVFKEPIIVENFKEKSNIMALTTQDNKIYVNLKNFKDLDTDRSMMYIIHELFHVLQNTPQFPEVRTINRILREKTLSKIDKKNINRFLTGKHQNIHSDYNNEFLSYCSNASFDWSIFPSLKDEYKKVLKNSGIFNFSSSWWKERFS